MTSMSPKTMVGRTVKPVISARATSLRMYSKEGSTTSWFSAVSTPPRSARTAMSGRRRVSASASAATSDGTVFRQRRRRRPSGGVVAQAAADGAGEFFDLPLLLAEDLALTGDHPLLFGEPALLLGEAAPVVLERLAQPLEFVGRRGVSAPPAGVRGRARTRTAGHLSAMA